MNNCGLHWVLSKLNLICFVNMVLCAAYGCNSRSGVDRVSFFRFPKNAGLRKIWIQRLNRGESATKSFAPNSHHRLCSKHFDDSSYILSPKFAQDIGYGKKFILRLKEDALPSIFVDAEGREKRPAPALRRSASAILEKKRKLGLHVSYIHSLGLFLYIKTF